MPVLLVKFMHLNKYPSVPLISKSFNIIISSSSTGATGSRIRFCTKTKEKYLMVLRQCAQCFDSEV